MTDRLYRSPDDRMLAGVAGGLAEMLDIDPSIVRIVWAVLIVLTGGLALLVYIVMAIVVPERPIGVEPRRHGGTAAGGADAAGGDGRSVDRHDPEPQPAQRSIRRDARWPGRRPDPDRHRRVLPHPRADPLDRPGLLVADGRDRARGRAGGRRPAAVAPFGLTGRSRTMGAWRRCPIRE